MIKILIIQQRRRMNYESLVSIAKDSIEIVFFATIIYHIALFLKKDHTYNLLPYFYSYLFLTIGCYFLDLATLNTILLLFSPCVIMFFALIHQETLQRNIVALKNVHTEKTDTSDWLSTLLQTTLIALNEHKELRCIIEHTDHMQELVMTSCPINAPLTPELLSLILQSKSYHPSNMLWVNSTGQLIGVNVRWRKSKVAGLLDRLEDNNEVWHQDVLLYTTKTDALVFWIHPNTGLFTIVAHGTEHEKLTASQAFQIIAQHCRLPFTIQGSLQKGVHHGANSRSSTSEQFTP